MPSWNDVLERTRRFVTDTVVAGVTPLSSDTEICDAWVAAQDDLVLYSARLDRFSVAEGATSIGLPDDCYRIVEVRTDNDGYRLLALGDQPDDDDVLNGSYWYLTNSMMEFSGSSGAPDDLTVIYRAHYPAPLPAELAMEILVPR